MCVCVCTRLSLSSVIPGISVCRRVRRTVGHISLVSVLFCLRSPLTNTRLSLTHAIHKQVTYVYTPEYRIKKNY